MYSIYDEIEGAVDGMMAYQACHPCHNGNKKCERPPDGGKCKRCAKMYIYHPWAVTGEPPTFSDGKVLECLSGLLDVDLTPALFDNSGGYHTLSITLTDSADLIVCEPSKIYFLGHLRSDNTYLVDGLDQIVIRDLLTPRVEVSHDPHGLVARACLAGGYLHLFFSVDRIVDDSEHPLNAHTLAFGLSQFIFGRISNIVDQVLSLAHTRPMSRNARLSLAALHVVVNRVKIFTSKLEHLRPFYNDPRLSTLLKDRIYALEAELRQIFQDDCDIIKDWGIPLQSCRKEFKNTARSLDPLTLRIEFTTVDELSEGDTYPTTVSTPGESAQSPLLIGLVNEIDLPDMPFAGLEACKAIFETDDWWNSDRTSDSPSPPSTRSSIEFEVSSMEELSEYGEDTAPSPKAPFRSDLDMMIAVPMDASLYSEFDKGGDPPTEWELLFDSHQLSPADNQKEDLGSPI